MMHIKLIQKPVRLILMLLIILLLSGCEKITEIPKLISDIQNVDEENAKIKADSIRLYSANKKLYKGILKGNYEMVNEAIEAGADPTDLDGRFVYGIYSNSVAVALFQENDEKMALYLISKGAKAEGEVQWGVTALSYSAMCGEYNLIKVMLEGGADTELKDWVNQATALDYATWSFHNNVRALDTCKLFIEHGAKVSQKTIMRALTQGGSSMVMIDLSTSDYKITQLVLKEYLKNEKDSGLSEAVEAAILGKSEIIVQLVNQNKIRDIDRGSVMFFTAAYGKPEAIEAMERRGVPIELKDNMDRSLLAIAAENNNVDMIKYLMGRNLWIDEENKWVQYVCTETKVTPLALAVRNSSYEAAEFLIKQGAKFTRKVDIADKEHECSLELEELAYNYDTKMLKLLEKNGYVLNDTDLTTMAADAVNSLEEYREEEKFIEFMKYLAERGLDISKVEYMPNYEFTKFLVDRLEKVDSHAGLFGTYEDAESVKYLIEHGADVNTVSEEKGDSILMRAVSRGCFDTVKYLVEQGADLTYQNKSKDNENVLLEASDGSSNILRYILEQGVDVDYQDAEKKTALMYAAIGDYEENAEILLKAGADTKIRDEEGKTAADYAADYVTEGKRKDVMKVFGLELPEESPADAGTEGGKE